MAMELKQSLQLRQQLSLTPQLQQAIKLLQMSRFELEQFVAAEISENPIFDFDASQAEQRPDASKDGFISEDQKEAEPQWAKSQDSGFTEGSQKPRNRASSHLEDLPPYYENVASNQLSLQEHLLKQLGEQELTEEEKNPALILVGYLDEKGFLEEDLATLCEKEKLNYEISEGVLDLIQRLDPAGVGAKNLQECLLLQLRGSKNQLAAQILKNHFDLFEKKKYAQIAKHMKLETPDLDLAIEVISRLSPNPGAAFGGAETIYIVPDVYVAKIGDKWAVYLNEDGLPQLKINEHYRNMMRQATEPKEKSYFQEKYKAASWLVRSLHQRQKTIFRVTEKIVEKQQEFFEQGAQHLKPLVLRNISEELGLHESTISRVTTNKYVHTPRGIFELKYFFSSSVGNEGEELASQAVKSHIKELIDQEQSTQPLTDQKIAQLLKEKGIHLARRTVAKYREQLGILTSTQRKS